MVDIGGGAGHEQAHLNLVFLLARTYEMTAGENLVAIASVGTLLRSAELKRIDIGGSLKNCTEAAERLK